MNRSLLILPLAVLAWIVGAATAHAELTTLYSNLDGPRTVTGIDSHPVGPTDDGDFRIASSFTPTRSGTAQLLSIRGRCVIPGADMLAGGLGADLLRGGPGGDQFADLGPGDRALDFSRRRGDRRGRS